MKTPSSSDKPFPIPGVLLLSFFAIGLFLRNKSEKAQSERNDEASYKDVYIREPIRIDVVQDLKQQYREERGEDKKTARDQLLWTRITAGLFLFSTLAASWAGWSASRAAQAAEKSATSSANQIRPWLTFAYPIDPKDIHTSAQLTNVQNCRGCGAMTVNVGFTLINYGQTAAVYAKPRFQLLPENSLPRVDLDRLYEPCAIADQEMNRMHEDFDTVFPGKENAILVTAYANSISRSDPPMRPFSKGFGILAGCISYCGADKTVYHTEAAYFVEYSNEVKSSPDGVSYFDVKGLRRWYVDPVKSRSSQQQSCLNS